MPPAETDNYWLNDFNTLELTTVGGTTDTVAGIRGVTIEAEYQTLEHLYTADSTKRVNSKQAQANVPVSIEFAFFDGEFVKEWLGGEGATGTSLTDTSDPELFELNGNFRNDDGTKQIDVTVTDITFENIPVFDGSMDEFIIWSSCRRSRSVTRLSTSSVLPLLRIAVIRTVLPTS